jgi:4-hydroxybenzoate polyprenyltransferase
MPTFVAPFPIGERSLLLTGSHSVLLQTPRLGSRLSALAHLLDRDWQILYVDKISYTIGATRSLLRCASCRYAALYFVPVYAGLTLAGRGTIVSMLLAGIFCFMFSVSVEVTNRLTDRAEDTINRPERTALCAKVGWHRLQVVEVAGWCAVVVLDALWLYLNPSPIFAGLLLSSAVFGVGYSRGLRLVRVRYIGLVVLNLAFGGVFVLGWAAGTVFIHGATRHWDQLASFAPLAVVVGIFVVTLAGIKDITDRDGDLSVGYRSPFVDLLERRKSSWLKALAAAPFVLICAFTLTGLLPLRLFALVAFAPCSALLVKAVLNVNTPHTRLVVRELFYRYWFVFSSASLLLFIPRLALVLATIGATLYWVIATQWLHWTPPVTMTEFRDLLGASGSRHSPRPMPPISSRS